MTHIHNFIRAKKLLYLMSDITKESQYVETLHESGLTLNEAMVYFAMVKYGGKGCIVKELDHELPIKRTNIYSVLKRLVQLGCAQEAGQAEKSKNATIFKAINPSDFINQLIEEKKLELETLEKIKNYHVRDLQSIYQEGMEFAFDEINPIIQPYFKPLLQQGWKIKSYIVRKGTPMFDYEVYDCLLHAPQSKYIKDNSFHLFIFDYDIEKDENALSFFINNLKKKTRETKSFFFDIKEIKLIDDIMVLNDQKYTIFKMEVKVSQLKDSVYFKNISSELREMNNREYFEIGKALIIPNKNKLFYLWAESDDILKDMAEPIFLIN